MPTRDQMRHAAALKHETRRAITGAYQRARAAGGDAELLADEVLQLIAIRYDLVPKQPANAKCPHHPGITLVNGICAACGPPDDGGD